MNPSKNTNIEREMILLYIKHFKKDLEREKTYFSNKKAFLNCVTRYQPSCFDTANKKAFFKILLYIKKEVGYA